MNSYSIFLFIQEKIDSKGELFPSTSIADVLFMFGSLSEEVGALRECL